MMWTYLAGLCISLAGLAMLDRRYKLAFWFDARRTAHTLAACVAIFVVWDIVGIALGIFRHGGSLLTLPIRLLPEFPIEELFFLTLLCYTALLIYRALERKC